MTISKTALWLSALVAGLALVAALVGLLYPSTDGIFSFTTVRGVTVELYGRGWYQLDTPIAAVGFMAADLVTLAVAIPLLSIGALLYRRGSLKGGFLLSGTLAYFLYNYGSLAFGSTYNHLYLIYTVIFSASLFGLLTVLLSFEVSRLPACFSARFPQRGISVFLIVSGVILSLVWLVLSIVPALLQGTTPLEAAFYTTFTTGVIDIAIVAPALIAAGLLLYRRAPLGYLLAATLLVFTVTLGVNLIAAGIAQLATGVISIGQAMGFTVPFVILTLIAAGFTVSLFTNFSEAAAGEVLVDFQFRLTTGSHRKDTKHAHR
jgi:hypothetical protein